MAQPLFSLDGSSLVVPQSKRLTASFRPLARDQVASLVAAKGEFAILIEIAMQRFRSGNDIAGAVKSLIDDLHHLRTKIDLPVWHELIPHIQAHPSAALLQQCPFTKWSFEKPRGYSGDARLIDFIYGHSSVNDELAKATATGLKIFDYTINAPGPVAVRERRDLLTGLVDETSERVGGGAEILSVAAGHLREAEHSKALRNGRLKRWVAIDQDPMSIGSISAQFRGTVVEALDGSVRGLLARKHRIGKFDLIYAAGLYDYLTERIAVRLTQACLEMLKPGGTLLFANFSDEMADDGYMESFMDWELLQRSEADMWRIANSSAAGTEAWKTVWFGSNRNIIYCTLRLPPLNAEVG